MENLPVKTLNLQALGYIQPLSREEIELRNKIGQGIKILDKPPALNYAEAGKASFVIVPEDIRDDMVMGNVIGYSIYLCPKDTLEEGLFSIYRVPRCDYALFCPNFGPAVDLCTVRNNIETHVKGFEFALQGYLRIFQGTERTPLFDLTDFYWCYMNPLSFLNATSELILRIDEFPRLLLDNMTLNRESLKELIAIDLGTQRAAHLVDTMIKAGAANTQNKELYQSIIDREPRKLLGAEEIKKELEQK